MLTLNASIKYIYIKVNLVVANKVKLIKYVNIKYELDAKL